MRELLCLLNVSPRGTTRSQVCAASIDLEGGVQDQPMRGDTAGWGCDPNGRYWAPVRVLEGSYAFFAQAQDRCTERGLEDQDPAGDKATLNRKSAHPDTDRTVALNKHLRRPMVNLVIHDDFANLARKHRQQAGECGEPVPKFTAFCLVRQSKFYERCAQGLARPLVLRLQVPSCNAWCPSFRQTSADNLEREIAAPDTWRVRREQHTLETQAELACHFFGIALGCGAQHQHSLEVASEL